MSTSMMEVPESQRLIAVSLGKIAASRGQKGGINLHKNLLVATVLHKARTAYMIQHINAAKQRAAPTPVPAPAPQCVEMKEQNVSEPSSPAASSSPSPAPTFQTAPSSPAAAPHSVTGVAALPETGSVPDGADVGGSAQVAECEDKENTPPPPSLPLRDATSTPASTTTTTSPECEKRLHEQAMDTGKDVKDTKLSRSLMSHAQQPSNNSTRDYVSGGKSCSSCLLKRRRAMDRDHENVSAPKVRIVESRVSISNTDSSNNQEAMQCDSPQISNLVNIFNTGFSGLSTVSSHKLSENLTCAKEMKFGLDSVHQPIVLSV